MDAEDDEGEVVDQVANHGEEEAVADLGDAADELELGALVDQVDVIRAFLAVEVALVDGGDAQEAGAPVGLGLFCARRC